jgi:S-DNA-T family DNA segregation ATPase FtsK/SpoIIIE
MGDMLYLHGSDFLRLQCAYVDTEEIDQIVNFIGDQVGYPMPFPLPEVEDEEQGGDMRDISNLDKLFADAARIVVTTQQGSTSLLQTKLNIGFARARRIIEQLEQAGIVGPPQGSKPRDVLIKDLNHLEQFLSNLN